MKIESVNLKQPIETLDLKNQVQYQDGSVVSKVIIKKKTGNVTIFAFDKGEGLSEHTAPFDAMVNILDGKAQINISGQPYILTEGQAIVMPAGEPHSLDAVEPFKMMLIMIKTPKD